MLPHIETVYTCNEYYSQEIFLLSKFKNPLRVRKIQSHDRFKQSKPGMYVRMVSRKMTHVLMTSHFCLVLRVWFTRYRNPDTVRYNYISLYQNTLKFMLYRLASCKYCFDSQNLYGFFLYMCIVGVLNNEFLNKYDLFCF